MKKIELISFITLIGLTIINIGPLMANGGFIILGLIISIIGGIILGYCFERENPSYFFTSVLIITIGLLLLRYGIKIQENVEIYNTVNNFQISDLFNWFQHTTIEFVNSDLIITMTMNFGLIGIIIFLIFYKIVR